MIAQISTQIFVSVVAGVITTLLTRSFEKNINLWIILGVVVTTFILYGLLITEGDAPPFTAIVVALGVFFLIALVGYIMGFGSPPFIKWRVKYNSAQWNIIKENDEESSGLISDGELIGEKGEQACQFRCQHSSCGVYGPYIYLPRDKYKAVFRIKMARTSDKDGGIEIDVAARDSNGNLGFKHLKSSHIAYTKFKHADTYYSFSQDFETSDKGETKVEFRVHCYVTGPAMTLDYIRLYRRLF